MMSLLNYSTLTDKQVKREIREMRKFVRVLAKDPAAAKEFLIKAGILTKSGKLSKQYR